MSGNKFELYEDDPLCAEGNLALDEAVDKAWDEAKPELQTIDPDTFNGERIACQILARVFNAHVVPVMQKYAKAGAYDSEPYYHAQRILKSRAHKDFGFSKYMDL